MATRHSASDRPRDELRGKERRLAPRSECDLPITVQLNKQTLEARVRDISRAGVCFFLERSIPLMTVLGVEFDLQTKVGKTRVRGQGAVVRSDRIAKGVDHFEIALFLHEMSEADRRVIDEFVGSRPTS